MFVGTNYKNSDMNFHYDPILGLQYSFNNESIVLNIDNIPRDFNYDDSKYYS